MKISKRIAWTIAGIVAFIMAAVAYTYLNKAHRDPFKEDASMTSPAELYQSMYLDAKTRWLDKTVQLRGKITEMTPGSEPVCVLEVPGASDAAVRVSFQKDKADALANLHVGDVILLKGICSGVLADTLMEGVISVDILIRDAGLVEPSQP